MMPVDEMETEAEDAARLSRELGEGRGVAAQDALVQELLAWFKSFFTWVRIASCSLEAPPKGWDHLTLLSHRPGLPCHPCFIRPLVSSIG